MSKEEEMVTIANTMLAIVKNETKEMAYSLMKQANCEYLYSCILNNTWIKDYRPYAAIFVDTDDNIVCTNSCSSYVAQFDGCKVWEMQYDSIL